ncbi:MAG: winged helix-turn-helix domain-containing protein, partial [Gammaproteobacteria bacterium]|nr:winged helix-turn-helix domain-containing protein [Gammaproteobacteria bacterium]
MIAVNPTSQEALGEDLPFQFKDWHVRPTELSISRKGTIHRITPMTMKVLVYLATRANHFVTTNELVDALWEGDITKGGGTLRNAIWQLRQILQNGLKNGDKEEELL